MVLTHRDAKRIYLQLCTPLVGKNIILKATILDKTYCNWPKLTIIMESPLHLHSMLFCRHIPEPAHRLNIDTRGSGGQKDIHLIGFWFQFQMLCPRLSQNWHFAVTVMEVPFISWCHYMTFCVSQWLPNGMKLRRARFISWAHACTHAHTHTHAHLYIDLVLKYKHNTHALPTRYPRVTHALPTRYPPIHIDLVLYNALPHVTDIQNYT